MNKTLTLGCLALLLPHAASAQSALSITAGNNQTVVADSSGTSVFQPITAVLTNGGKPVAGTPVTFQAAASGQGFACHISPNAPVDTVTVSTNSKGQATLAQLSGNSMACGFGFGTATITASTAGGTKAAATETAVTMTLTISNSDQSVVGFIVDPSTPTVMGCPFDVMAMQLTWYGKPLPDEQLTYTDNNPVPIGQPSPQSPMTTDNNGLAVLSYNAPGSGLGIFRQNAGSTVTIKGVVTVSDPKKGTISTPYQLNCTLSSHRR